MEYIKCPHCGSDTPADSPCCENSNEQLSVSPNDESPKETYIDDETTIVDDVTIDYDLDDYPEKRKGITKYIVLGVILLILAVAAIKNPSPNESKQMIREMAVEYVNKKAASAISDKDTDGAGALGALLGMFIAPTVIDKMLDIEVNDYILFSTFKVSTNFDSEKDLASGIILFGKLIPF